MGANLIYFNEDIAEEYAKGRKGVTKEEAEDLLRCVVMFLQRHGKKNHEMSYRIPRLGLLHKKMATIEEEMPYVNRLFENAVFTQLIREKDYWLLQRRDKLDSLHEGKTKQELQQWQNYGE